MSRLIVKNLPSYITPTLLKEHFSQSNGPGGAITDVKIALKQDGTARRFGFIGFKTDKEALDAKEWYNKTFIDSTRVRVEVIDGVKDAPRPRPNKRRRLVASPAEPSATLTRKKMKNSVDSGSLAMIKSENPNFEEFMEVMQSKAKRAVSWADQADPFSSSSKKDKIPATQTLPNPPEIKAQGHLTDMEWMQQRMKGGVEDIASLEVCFNQSDDGEQEPKISGGQIPAEETILSTGRLFVRNLTFTCTEEELRGLFQSFGVVSQIHIPIDPLTKESKGLAFVTYVQSQDALTALRTLDGKSFQGRLLHIIGAIDRNSNAASAESSNKPKTLKEQRKEKRKVVSGKEFNWSMLYMNSDAVLSSVADRMNIPKSDILDPESSDAAVKLALAESHIIQETKTYLESHGVVLSAFSERGRSETIILVKNIPYGTTAEQLHEMFGTHGELQRVLVPPAGTLAVIEFVHADEARKAFRAIAYRRLGNSIVYLEKGPLGMFQPIPSTSEVVNGILPVAIEDPDAENGANLDITGGKTLFVKNLAFATSSERFTLAFHHLPGFAFARVQTKQDPKRPSARLSMGFGFVGFRTTEAAQKALKGMHGLILDGHTLSVRFAGRGAEEQEETKGEKEKARTTKMLVKNVPFEATRKDIQQLFGAYGQLKSVRLPKRFDRRSRGFAFLEFVTRHEAENAFNALRHTHLLGRHLVLEWAEEGDVNIDELRRKAGVGLGDGSDMPGKKRKLVLAEDRDGGEDDV